MILFQFLIGSLEAGFDFEISYIQEFQFLIGSLEAACQDWRQRERPEFQFLIGSLEARR